MSTVVQKPTTVKPLHPWLHTVNVAFVPGPEVPALEETIDGILRHFRRLGHHVQERPQDDTDVVLTTARFGEAINWRDALLFSIRRRFNLSRAPTIFTLMYVSSQRFQELLEHLEDALAKEQPDPADYDFPGLAPEAHQILLEQGRRGGPIMALERLIQAQSKSIRIILVVGDEQPIKAYHFDLVGAHPCSKMTDPESFYEDIVLRTVTTISTTEVTDHCVVGESIPYDLWRRLETPPAMCRAGRELGRRDFFTHMVRIDHLVQVPAVSDAVSSQYSEGCFSTWDPTLGALIATVTGSARPVDKGSISEDDLAVIVGICPGGGGAQVRQVEGKRNDPPSSEAVEMLEMDEGLPTITLDPAWGISDPVPVVRSKLHGHRGVATYDPRWVEYVPLKPAYYHYLVSCATDAQARGIEDAFAHSESLQNPEDPRPVAFTVLPGHGVVIVEKWVAGKAPFQLIWEFMDEGYLEVENRVPQGPMEYVPGPGGKMVLWTG